MAGQFQAGKAGDLGAGEVVSGDDDVADTAGVAAVTTRAEFGARLTELRTRSGRSLRDLARAIDGSPSTVGDWCRGDRLPYPSQHGVFVRLMGELGVADPAPWVDVVVRLRDGAARHRRRAGEAPYRGLKSFGRDDAEWFFGRAELVERAVKRLRRLLDGDDRPRCLVVVGASGSGKSSLLQAGLRPALEADGYECVPLTPGPEPADRLRAALAEAPVTDAGPGTGRVVIVDQMEELFSECRDDGQRERFLAAVEALAAPGALGATEGGGGPGVRAVVLGLRIDFYADLAATGHLADALQDAQVLVGPMNRAQLTAAIVEPARRAGFSIDDALVDALLRDFVPGGSLAGRHDAGALPLLSHALLETWRRAGRGRMTVDDYRAAGGVGRAVEESAEWAYAALAPADRAPVRQAFLRLVHLDGDAVATRRSASYTELYGLVPDGDGDPRAQVMALLDPFVEARLLTAHASTLGIAHEALLAAWPRLRGWIEDDREALGFHRRIGDAARLWAESDRDPSTLASGVRLAAMQAWSEANGRTVLLNRDERAFLAASADRAAEDEARRRRRARRLRALAGVTTAFAVLAGVLAVSADRARDDAVAARDEALSRQLAVSAERLAETDPGLGAQLAVAGYRIAPTSEARSALLRASGAPRPRRYLGGAGPTALAASPGDGLVAVSDATDGSVQLFTRSSANGRGGLERAAVIPADDPETDVYALALTPDETTLAVGDTSAVVTLWDVHDPGQPEPLAPPAAGPLTGPEGPVQQLVVSPDGSELAATGQGDGVFRWDIRDPASPRSLPLVPAESTTWGLAYHPDGTTLAFGQDTGAVELWRVGAAAPRRLADLDAGDRPAFTVAFAPDGSTLATGSQAGELRAWDVSSPEAPTPIEVADNRFDAWVNDAAFSPDGSYLVAGSSDGSLRVWDTATWARARDLPHPAALTQLAFADDGALLVTAAADGTARLWELARSVPAHMEARVFSLTFTPDGGRLGGFAGQDSAVWDVTDPRRPRPVVGFASPDPDDPFSGSGDLSPDGTLLAQGTVGGAVYLADVTDPGDPVLSDPLAGAETGPERLVESAAFSADGGLLAAGRDDTTVRVWDVTNPARPSAPVVLDEPTEIVLNVTWSPTEPLLAANSADGLTYLYDLRDPRRPRLVAQLDGFEAESYASAFTPDGGVLAVGGSDTVVLLWDVSDPRHPRRIGGPLGGPGSRIYDLAFAPDGSALAAAVTDGTAWLWGTEDLEAPERRAVFAPTDSPLFTVAFAPDGSYLAAAGADQEVHLWPLSEDAAIADICAAVGDPITEREWSTYLPTRPYDRPC